MGNINLKPTMSVKTVDGGKSAAVKSGGILIS